MAPRKIDGEGKSKAVKTPVRQTRSMERKTRSQTKRDSSGSATSSNSKRFTYESPEKRKRKSKAKEAGPATKKNNQEKEEEPAAEAKPDEEDDVAAEEDDAAAEEDAAAAEEEDVAAEEDDVAAEEDAVDAEEDAVDAEEGGEGSVNKKIEIEHCKQCRSFKQRANEVKAGLEKALPGILVTLNADKPRRGCFEIREEGGETFISLLDMKRPFKEMKDLDMEQVIADIVEKLK